MRRCLVSGAAISIKPRLFLSPPHLSGSEQGLIREALESNWVAPAGPMLARFEEEFARIVDVSRAVATSSGTAALHLALLVAGVCPGDRVLCPTLTFAASAFPVFYVGAHPVLIDCDPTTWTIDVALVEEELAELAAIGSPARAVIAVDLLGHSADYDALRTICDRYETVLIEDAAQAVGSTYKDRPLGGMGLVGCVSFNGNKIITTSSGGMLVSSEPTLADQAAHLASQARMAVPYFEHDRVGFNYRMSNVLAAIGLAQLTTLDKRVEARRRTFDAYRQALDGVPGITFAPEASWTRSNRWLTCVLIDEGAFGASREEVRIALERDDIEARGLYRPLHEQKPFARSRVKGGVHAEGVFRKALCLPSGSGMTADDIRRVVEGVLGASTHYHG